MRAAILGLGFFLALPAPAGPHHTLPMERFLHFMGAASHFERELFACPPEARYVEDCTTQSPVGYNQAEWDSLYSQGRELFK